MAKTHRINIRVTEEEMLALKGLAGEHTISFYMLQKCLLETPTKITVSSVARKHINLGEDQPLDKGWIGTGPSPRQILATPRTEKVVFTGKEVAAFSGNKAAIIRAFYLALKEKGVPVSSYDAKGIKVSIGKVEFIQNGDDHSVSALWEDS